MDSKILVVDDNPVNRKLLSSILAREGYSSMEADNGEDALRLARQEDPDVILLDIMMPGLDGFTVCQQMRQDPKLEDTPVLFLSALSEVKDRVKGFDVGANDYITKPYHQTEVIARVRRSLSLRRKAQRQKRRQLAVEDSERDLQKSHQSAMQLMQSQLPSKEIGAQMVETAWWQESPLGLCGELFNAIRLSDNKFAFFIFDVGGQDLAAAATAMAVMKLMSAKPGSLLTEKNAEGSSYVPASPEKVLAGIDRTIGLQGIDTFFYMQYLLLDARTGELQFANVGGKPYPLVLRFDGNSEWLSGQRPSSQYGQEDFYQGKVQLRKGDRVYLMTDGVVMSGATQSKPYGEGRVESILGATRGRDLKDNVDTLNAALQAYSGDTEARSLLAFEYLGPKG